MTHLDTSNTSYGQKKGRESNWQFDSRPLKVENFPDFLVCRRRATYRWKSLNNGYNFASNLISSEVYKQCYEPPKSRESQLWEFRDSHFGVPKQNAIWMWALWRGTKYTIRGKVVASPKSEPWWILWVWVCLWFILTPKVFQHALTNSFGLCRSVWINELLVHLPSFIPELQHALVPSKCCEEQGMCKQLLALPLF